MCSFSFLLTSLLPAFVVLWRQKQWRSLAPLPPGPPRIPVVGSIFNVPRDFAWKTYLDWGKKYGSDILYINVFGTPIVVVNSQEIATDLLVKRWRVYSGRQVLSTYATYDWSLIPSCMTCDHIESDWSLACMSYSDAWRISRRVLAKYFLRSLTGSKTSASFTDIEWQRPHVVKHTRYFLRDLLQDPDSLKDHTLKLAVSVSISSSHGLDISADPDDYLILVKRASDVLSLALELDPSWFDIIPFFRLGPKWAKAKRMARSWGEDVKRYLVVPFVRAKRNFILQNHNARVEMPSILSQELTKSDLLDQRILQEASANVAVGASSTSSAALRVFFLAMTCYPEAQKRAQVELDSLLTKKAQQLPTHDDLGELPFCMAVVYEVLRWHVISPLSLPHLSVSEDIYEGYRIPKGSIIVPNIWAMMRDPIQFEDPCEFRPERFLNAEGKLDKASVKKIDPVFGFGRRVCVGRSLALSILAYAACCVLAVFDIQKKLNDKGEPIMPRLEFESSIISSPLPFVCLIRPRSPETEKTVAGLFERVETDSMGI